MSSLDHRQNSTVEQHGNTDPLQLSGLHIPQPPVEQLSFPEYSPIVGNTHTSSTAAASDVEPGLKTRALSPSPLVTRELIEVKTDAFSAIPSHRDTTTLRHPVIIRGTGRKSSSLRPPESRRKPAMHAIVTIVLALVVLSALFAVLPVGTNGQSSILKSIMGIPNDQMNISNVRGNDTALIAQQAATATVVTTDGFDHGAAAYAGVPTAPPSMSGSTGSTGSTGGTGGTGGSTGGAPISGGSGFNRFFYGQCTYWANMRYYQLTGHEVPWIGNAYQWTAGAYNYGWVVSTMPHVPSIIVLPPGVELAGGFGHVAVVESINADGSVVTSNQNWAGHWAQTTYVTFTPNAAAGVRFVWY